MTKIDYIIIAEAINEELHYHWKYHSDDEEATKGKEARKSIKGFINHFIDRISIELLKDNPSFDYKKFRKACWDNLIQ